MKLREHDRNLERKLDAGDDNEKRSDPVMDFGGSTPKIPFIENSKEKQWKTIDRGPNRKEKGKKAGPNDGDSLGVNVNKIGSVKDRYAILEETDADETADGRKNPKGKAETYSYVTPAPTSDKMDQAKSRQQQEFATISWVAGITEDAQAQNMGKGQSERNSKVQLRNNKRRADCSNEEVRFP